MADFGREKFRQYWRGTEVIREYQRMLYTFSDIELPYVFVAEHREFPDRTVINQGTLILQKPHIVLPSRFGGPQFAEGFEHADAIPPEAAYIFRAAKLPYSRITNKPLVLEKLEYGRLQEVLKKTETMMDRADDTETGLIKGDINGADVSLMRYSLGLVIKSAPGNLTEFLEHIRKQSNEPIKPGEKITDEEIRRLFG